MLTLSLLFLFTVILIQLLIQHIDSKGTSCCLLVNDCVVNALYVVLHADKLNGGSSKCSERAQELKMYISVLISSFFVQWVMYYKCII